MRKIVLVLAGACCMLFASCASTSFSNFSEFPLIESGNLPSDRYIVMGTVSGASNLTMTAEEYNKLIKNEFDYEPQNVQVKFVNDSGDYGFIGKPVNIKMNVFERSVALAEYKMIQTAKHNQADAIYCLKSNISIEKNYKNIIVKTVVTGYAVKIKPDTGYTIVVPDEEDQAPEPEAEAEDSEVTEVSDTTSAE